MSFLLVCVLIEDATRSTPHHTVIAEILECLRNASHIRIIVATGSHASDSPAQKELKESIEKAVVLQCRTGMSPVTVHVHDCEKDSYVLMGITRKGTPVLVNDKIADADMYIAFSDMKNHYFAGYSNPTKLFFPGVAHFSAIEKNHSLTLKINSTFGKHPLHPDKERRLNPLAEDIYDAYTIMKGWKPVYACAIISYEKKAVWASFDTLEAVIPEAIKQVDALTSFTVKPAERIIVSPGGYPDDESLYISQRALELTKAAVKPGGEILFLSQCRFGIGAERTMEHFYNRLTAPLADVVKNIETEYRLYSHKPFKFAQLLMQLRRLWIYTDLSEEIVSRIHLKKCFNPQEVIDRCPARPR